MQAIEFWLAQYEYLTLFIGLLLEYIALPFPGELVMGYSGYLIYQGELQLLPALLLSWLGTSIGMSITYFIGRKLGYPFLSKYGRRFSWIRRSWKKRRLSVVLENRERP